MKTAFETKTKLAAGISQDDPAPLDREGKFIGAAGDTAAQRSERILVVEDSRVMRAMLVALLAEVGYADVLTADSAGAAFRALGLEGEQAGERVDLILLDMILPDTDGIETLKVLGTREALRNVPVIMVTGMREADVLQRAFEAGASDYVTKPFDKIELQARVGAALRLKQAIDALEVANRRLAQLAQTDGLTGVANRRQFDQILRAEWQRAARERWPLSLLLMDIDHFKRYNDAHGHQAGDHCLRVVAETLDREAARPGDLAARYGGEEFALILPNTDLAGALTVGERLRASLAARALPHGASPTSPLVTLSIGVATMKPDAGTGVESLITLADQSLYTAKAGGRDRIAASGG